MPFAGIFELYGAYTDGIYSATKLNKIQILYNFSQLKVANIYTASNEFFYRQIQYRRPENEASPIKINT